MSDTNTLVEITIDSTGSMTAAMAEQSQRALIEAFKEATTPERENTKWQPSF